MRKDKLIPLKSSMIVYSVPQSADLYCWECCTVWETPDISTFPYALSVWHLSFGFSRNAPINQHRSLHVSLGMCSLIDIKYSPEMTAFPPFFTAFE